MGQQHWQRAHAAAHTAAPCTTPAILPPCHPPIALQDQQEASRNEAFQAAMAVAQANNEEEEEFSRRLQALKQEGREKRQAAAASTPASSSSGNSSSSGSSKAAQAQGASPPVVAAFDQEDIYANPPTVTQTLMGALNSDVSDPALRSAQFGPNQVAVAGGALIFGLAFILVSGGDLQAPSSRFKGVRPAQEAPDSVEQGLLRGAISQLEESLAASPNDTQASEQLALAYARLQEFDKASGILEKLVARAPKDADAWRVRAGARLRALARARSLGAAAAVPASRCRLLLTAPPCPRPPPPHTQTHTKNTHKPHAAAGRDVAAVGEFQARRGRVHARRGAAKRRHADRHGPDRRVHRQRPAGLLF